MTYQIGVDLSHWDGMVNWDATAANAKFAWLKAGQGWGYDNTFMRNYTEGTKRGVPLGAYWYYDAYVPPLVQAANFAKAVLNLQLPLGLTADFEDARDGQYRGWRSFAVFLQRLMELVPATRICIYTGYYYWIGNSPSKYFNYASYKWFAQFPLWLAQYNGLSAPNRIPGPWSTWTYWQFTEKGDADKYGSQAGGCDLNYSNAPVQPEPTPYRQAVTTANLNVRTGAGTTYSIVGTLLKGTQVSVDKSSNGWAHVVATATQPLTGWSSEAYLTYL